jgi:hypothetical protein
MNMAERDWLRLPVISAGAEYWVMGYLRRRTILTYKAPPNNEGYDLICIHPGPPRRRGSDSPHLASHLCQEPRQQRRVAGKKVAALMGHSNLNTTSIYTIPSALDLERAVAQIGE